jgi:Protein of unknown function (DUF3592)
VGVLSSLSVKRRRRPTLLAAWHSFGLVFGAIWLLVGIPFFAIGVGTAWTERRYATDGVVVEGIVLSKDPRRSSDNRTHAVRYRFITRDGQEVEGRADIGRAAWEALAERAPLSIVYLPGRPTSSRVVGESQWMLPVVFLFVGGTLTLVGGSVVARALLLAWARIGLGRRGITVTGTVTDVVEAGMGMNRRTPWRLQYRYVDHRGLEHRGVSGDLSAADAAQWQPGNTGTVRYDRDRPNRSVWLGNQPSR